MKSRLTPFPPWLLGAVFVTLAAGGGCNRPGSMLGEGNAAQPGLETKTFPISCDDGRRIAARALKARNFQITRVERSPNGGTVEGKHPKDGYTARIDVSCVAQGVTMVPSAGGRSWVEQGLRFGFYQIVDFGDRVYPPPTGPVVKLALFRGPEAKLEFPQELEPLGMVAVQVRLMNAGERWVRVDPRRLHATATGGARALPLLPMDAEKKLAGIDPDAAKKVLRGGKVKPGDSLMGFVFFPVADYQEATLFLIDDKTGEADEYSVSFVESS